VNSDFFLLEFENRDGQDFATLGEQTSDSGAIAFNSKYHFDPYTTISATHPGVQSRWAGLYTVTPDWNAIMDQVDESPGLILGLGFSGS
jgi:sarcosine oxidase subunit beta